MILTDLLPRIPAPSEPPDGPGPTALSAARPLERTFTVREITDFILPMAPEHFRRTLAAHPDLPQGVADPAAATGGGMRRFRAADLVRLRAFFEAQGGTARYAPHRGGGPAHLVVLAAPLGAAGRSTVAAHLGIAGALAGHRVLLVEADASGHLAARLGAAPGSALLGRLAGQAGARWRTRNAGRVDQGEPPVPLPQALVRAARDDSDPVPTAWPGLDILPGGAPLAGAEPALADWGRALPGWSGAEALGAALAPLRAGRDLILIDPPRGLGPLALACLAGTVAAGGTLLAPIWPGGRDAHGRPDGQAAGLAALARAIEGIETAASARADALGLPAPAGIPARVLALPMGETAVETPLPAFPRLPDPEATLFWDRDYREMGRLDWTPPRAALAACWTGLAQALEEAPKEGPA